MSRAGRLFGGFALVVLLVILNACGAADKEPIKTGESSAAPIESTSGVVNKERVFKSLKGDITIPVDPKRVIGLSVVYPEFLYALGVTPIAVQNYHPEFPLYLKEPLKDTLKMGIAKSPNFEAILAENPDLIIAPTWWADKDYDQLSKIAPTILLPQRDNWRDELKDIAEVLGKQDLALKVIEDLANKKAAAKLKLDALVGDQTVMYMMIMAKELVIYSENIDRGSFIHKELGLNPIKNFLMEEHDGC